MAYTGENAGAGGWKHWKVVGGQITLTRIRVHIYPVPSVALAWHFHSAMRVVDVRTVRIAVERDRRYNSGFHNSIHIHHPFIRSLSLRI